jgi:putative zinc finger/helix-turn-helix YgiT family protein
MKRNKSTVTCPQCGEQALSVEVEKKVVFKGADLNYSAHLHRCAGCGLELASVEDAADMQDRLTDAYRRKVGLLDGEQIRGLRRKKGLSQQALADALEIGIASVKRWENGVIQSRAMDNLLRTLLEERPCNEHTGNRDFSIPRIRLVLDTFQRCLDRPLLKKNDKMLYAAKYLWYADMTARRDLGRGITGATYAALPMGPQLNNYRDLVDEILKADSASAEPLSAGEKAVIAAVAKTFPTNKAVYDAAHREPLWRDCPTGALIPYTRADSLSEMPKITSAV